MKSLTAVLLIFFTLQTVYPAASFAFTPFAFEKIYFLNTQAHDTQPSETKDVGLSIESNNYARPYFQLSYVKLITEVLPAIVKISKKRIEEDRKLSGIFQNSL